MSTLRLDTLRRRQDFVRIAQGGKKSVTHSIVLQASQTPQLLLMGDSLCRVGFTVTKKVGNSVIRNRVKRRMRAAAREIIAKQGKAQMDYVLIGRNFCVQCPYDTLLKDLTYALGKVQGS